MATLREWLGANGLDELYDALAAHHVELDILGELADGDLREIGLTLGQRKRLLRALAARAPGATPPPSSGAPPGMPVPAPATSPRVAAEAERRQMTVLFCDLVGAGAVAGRIDPEDMFEVIGAYQRCATAVVQRAGGHVARYIGDSMLAYFGYPEAREDDPERAVRAGLDLVAAVRGIAPRPGVVLDARVGIHTGLVVVGDLVSGTGRAADAVAGETPNVAARLHAAAPPGGVLMGEPTRRLVGGLFDFVDCGSLEIKGVAAPMQAWRATGESGAQGRFEARAGSGLTRLVGRAHELGIIRERWRLALGGEGQTLLLSGEAGIGKSRLADAMRRELEGEAQAQLRLFCSQFHAGEALYPVAENLRRAAGLRREDDADAKRAKLGALLRGWGEDPARSGHLLASLFALPPDPDAPPPAMAPQERRAATLDLFLRRIEALARGRGLLMIVEDAHWIDPTSGALLGALVARIRALPVLLVVTLRPEFVPAWRTQPNVTLLQLNRLDHAQGLDLIAGIDMQGRLGADLRADVLQRAGGIPLFVEELTRAMLEAPAAPDAGTGAVAPRIPAILRDALTARLDALGAAKEAALWAAVLGRGFQAALLAAAAALPRDATDTALARLLDAGILVRHRAGGEEVFEFRHALIEDAAYASLLRGRRQQMHARAATALEAGWLQDAQPDDLLWLHPALARHWRRAGEGVPPLREEWIKAIAHYAAAGERAAAAHANEEAIGFLREALALLGELPRDEALARRELHLQLALGAAAVASRSYAAPEVHVAYARASELCATVGDHALTFRALRGLWQYRQGQGEMGEAARIGQELLALAARSGDAALLLEANRLLGNTAYFAGDFVAARRHMEQAVELFDPAAHGGLVAQFGQDPDAANRGLLGWALARLGYPEQGRGQIVRAVERAETIGHPFSMAYAHGAAMWSSHFLIEFAEAARWAQSTVAIARARGFAYLDVAGQVVGLWVRARSGEADALDALDAVIGRWRAGGATIGMHSFLVVLADAWLHAGWPDRAERTLGDGLIAQRGINERFLEAEIQRLRGEATAAAGRPHDAHALLMQAWTVAEGQRNRLALLRIATSMARLGPASPGSAARLRRIHAGFAEGHDLAVLREARAVLETLPGSDGPDPDSHFR